MRDPHVVALRYKVEPIPPVTFNNPPRVEDEINSFRVILENGKATIELKDHFSSVEEARKAVESFLRAWEIYAALRSDRQEIKFVLEGTEVIDRNPPQGSPVGNEMTGCDFIGSATTLEAATVSFARREYPAPPKHFKINVDVDTLWHRFEGYSQGREPLLSMAYFCLTVVEARAGGRRDAVKKYGVHLKVLAKLGTLTTTRGDKKTARKVKNISAPTPLTPAEAIWIEAAIKAIIRRVGEIDSDPSVRIITMSDLPAL